MKIGAIVHSSESKGCPYCSERLDGIDEFEKAAKHLQAAHSLTCLHIGTETHLDRDGKPWHNMVAAFGSDELPPERVIEPLTFVVTDHVGKDIRRDKSNGLK